MASEVPEQLCFCKGRKIWPDGKTEKAGSYDPAFVTFYVSLSLAAVRSLSLERVGGGHAKLPTVGQWVLERSDETRCPGTVAHRQEVFEIDKPDHR